MTRESCRPLLTLPRWQFWSVLTIAALTSGGIACDRHLNADPTFAIPRSIPLPSPNGYDDYRRAVALHRERDYDKRTGKPKPLTPTQVDALFRDNAAAIRALHTGFTHEYRMPPERPNDFPATSDHTDSDGFRSLARTLAFESEQRAAHGDVDGALGIALDGVKMGAILPRGGGAREWEYGNVCEAIVSKGIWSLAPRLNADQAVRAASRLKDAEARRVSFTDSLREEEWRGITERCGFLRDANLEKLRLFNVVGEIVSATTPTKPNDSRTVDETTPPAESRGRWKAWAQVAFLSKQQIVDNYAAWMQAQIAEASVPYNTPPPLLPGLDPFNRMMEIGYRQERFRGTYHQTDECLLTTTLALRAYRLRTGAYPPGLASLVEAGILRRVPTDPFARSDGTPLLYQPLARDTYRLYSVGPDGIDDGGRSIDVSKPEPNGMVFKNRGIISTDKGDMLARWLPPARP